MKFFKFILMILLLASIAACTTTTKKLTKTKKLVNQPALFNEAKLEYGLKNYQRSASLLSPLAKQGHTEAQYALGYMYYNGTGVPRNYKMAIQWLSIAAAKGNKKATEALRRITPPSGDIDDSKDQESSSISQPSPESVLESETTNIDKPVNAALDVPVSKEPWVIVSPSQEKALLTEVSPEVVIQPELTATTELAEESKQEQQTKLPEVLEKEVSKKEVSEKMLSSDVAEEFSMGEKWIMSQPDEHYTLQLIATDDEDALRRFIKKNNIQGSAVYYRTRNKNGSNWFTLVQGSFESFSQANSAIKQLSPPLKKMQPWIKPIAGIHKALSAR